MTRAYNTATTQQNSGGAVPAFLAGKNAIINGAFNVWQRGTSFSNPTAGSFVADRYYIDYTGTIGTTTISQQTTPTVIATGVNTSSFLRWSSTVAGTSQSYNVLSQRIENVATFAEQTVTVSFYAKAAASTALSQIYLHQNFGSGGSSEIYYNLGSATVTTSWARYSFTTTLGSLSGKTIGAGSYLRFFIGAPLNSTFTIDTWGWQVEAGSVATAFQTATGTIQGELAACNRYFQISQVGVGKANGTTTALVQVFWNNMRIAPAYSIPSLSSILLEIGVAYRTPTSSSLNSITTNVTSGCSEIYFQGASGMTTGNLVNIGGAVIQFSAEL
jgi:hypothetical protein